MNDTNETPALTWEPSPAEMYQARLSRLVSEAAELQRRLNVALARAMMSGAPTDSQETDARIIEGEFSAARRALRSLVGDKP